MIYIYNMRSNKGHKEHEKTTNKQTKGKAGSLCFTRHLAACIDDNATFSSLLSQNTKVPETAARHLLCRRRVKRSGNVHAIRLVRLRRFPNFILYTSS